MSFFLSVHSFLSVVVCSFYTAHSLACIPLLYGRECLIQKRSVNDAHQNNMFIHHVKPLFRPYINKISRQDKWSWYWITISMWRGCWALLRVCVRRAQYTYVCVTLDHNGTIHTNHRSPILYAEYNDSFEELGALKGLLNTLSAAEWIFFS